MVRKTAIRGHAAFDFFTATKLRKLCSKRITHKSLSRAPLGVGTTLYLFITARFEETHAAAASTATLGVEGCDLFGRKDGLISLHRLGPRHLGSRHARSAVNWDSSLVTPSASTALVQRYTYVAHYFTFPTAAKPSIQKTSTSSLCRNHRATVQVGNILRIYY